VSKLIINICSRHDIAKILLKLALNTDQSINDNLTEESCTFLKMHIAYGVANV